MPYKISETWSHEFCCGYTVIGKRSRGDRKVKKNKMEEQKRGFRMVREQEVEKAWVREERPSCGRWKGQKPCTFLYNWVAMCNCTSQAIS